MSHSDEYFNRTIGEDRAWCAHLHETHQLSLMGVKLPDGCLPGFVPAPTMGEAIRQAERNLRLVKWEQGLD